jgi:hypothetical protein
MLDNSPPVSVLTWFVMVRLPYRCAVGVMIKTDEVSAQLTMHTYPEHTPLAHGWVAPCSPFLPGR